MALWEFFLPWIITSSFSQLNKSSLFSIYFLQVYSHFLSSQTEQNPSFSGHHIVYPYSDSKFSEMPLKYLPQPPPPTAHSRHSSLCKELVPPPANVRSTVAEHVQTVKLTSPQWAAFNLISGSTKRCEDQKALLTGERKACCKTFIFTEDLVLNHLL